jgi:16S rRNA (cytosine1402-N4)-methyltransferase
MEYHIPVLLKSSIDLMDIKSDGVYVDVTFGGGGHSREILTRMGKNAKGKLYGFDQDEDAVKNALPDEQFVFVQANFRDTKRMLRFNGVKEVDAILADLGVSSHQFDAGERGFSYRFDAALDMRMNQKEGKTAADILNKYDAVELQRIFSEYGELRNSKTLAQEIVKSRHNKPYRNISDLLRICEEWSIGDKMRYLSQVFQALRIEVNEEMSVLKEFLEQSLEVLKPGGRLVVISYHSLEDRMVKNFLKSGNIEGNQVKDFYGNIERPFELITKKALEADAVELKRNPRSRSAKMRAGIKK